MDSFPNAAGIKAAAGEPLWSRVVRRGFVPTEAIPQDFDVAGRHVGVI